MKDKRTRNKPGKIVPSNRRRRLAANDPIAARPRKKLMEPNEGTQDLNFKVAPALHRAFKVVAAERGMPMKDLLDASFRYWLEQHGTDAEREKLPPKTEKKSKERRPH